MEQFDGASDKSDRATAAEPVVSALRDGIPSAIAGQACTISKTGSTVTIECDDAGEANELFDWLAEL